MSFKKLTTQLQSFDKPLLKQFRVYVHSAYFNVPPAAVLFFNYLDKLHPGFDEKKLSAETIAAKEPKLFDKNSQAKAASALIKAVEQFLSLHQWQKKEMHHPLYLLEAQKHLGLYEAFESTALKFKKDLDQCAEKDIDYFNSIHLLTELESTGFKARLQRNTGNTLQPVTQTLDIFYAIKKIRYHCELLNRKQVIGTDYRVENTEGLLQVLQPFNSTQYPYVYLFVNTFKMMRAGGFIEGGTYYQSIYSYISNGNFVKLPQGVAECISYLINYCLYWNNKGYEQAGADALRWYEFSLKHGLLTRYGLMQPAEFRNIISLSIINKRSEKWLKQFIDTYSPLLPGEHIAINQNFAMGQYFYYIKKYDEAMPLFQQALVKYEPISNMIVRRWQFMCMYEHNTDSKEMLLDFLIAWERQLYRTADSLHELKQVFGKVISYSKKLLACSVEEQRKQIVTDLEQEEYFAGKTWIIEQLTKYQHRRTEAQTFLT